MSGSKTDRPAAETSSFLRLSDVGLLLAGAALYAIGGAVADYLGRRLDLTRLVLGLLATLMLLLLAQYLGAYFQGLTGRTQPDAEVRQPAALPRTAALYAAIVCGGLLAVVLTGMVIQRAAPLAAWVILGIGIGLAFAYHVPPLRLASSGYGELTASIGLAGLVPGFGFAMQAGEAHRLVWMATAPLIALTFSMLITRRLRDYARDLRQGRQTLVVRLGWETAMRLHDGAILLAVVLMAAGVAGGLPQRIGFGGLILLPLAAAQVWQMRRIRNGYPPRWRVLSAVALALPLLLTYFVLTGFLMS